MEKIRRIPILVWFLVVAVIILVGGVWYFSTMSDDAMKEGDDLSIVSVSKPVAGTKEFKIESRHHTASGVPVTNYNSNPPNSGDHWAAPAKNGIYDKQLPDEQLVHNLEHGHVWIAYMPEGKGEATTGAKVKPASKEVIKKLEEIVKADDWKIVLEPRSQNQSTIALAAWGRVLNMDTVDYEKVKDFIRTYRNHGPEKTPE